MPIDPSIALGVRPIEQPNMLAQMGQMMQLRQAQQGYESENALRDFYSQGGDTTTAEGRRKLMAASPITGMKLIGQQSEIAARDLGSTEKAIKLYKDQIGGVTDSASAASLMTAVYLNPLTRPFVESMAPLDKALSAIPNDPAALEQWKRGFGLTADKLFVDANTMATNQARIQAANIGAVAPNRQATLAEQEAARKQQELGLVRGILTGGATNPTAPPVANNPFMGGGGGNGGGQLGSGTFGIPMGGGAQPPATGVVGKPNVLATQVAPTTAVPPTNVNGLNPNAPPRVDDITRQLTQLAKVGGPVANQAMEGLIKEYNVLNPEGEIKLTSNGTLVSVNKRTNKAEAILGADGKPVMGQVAPVTKDVLDPTDPARKRMITVEVNSYVAGTGLGADGNAPAPRGVLGVATSQIAPNYIQDPLNPQGVKPVPGSPADPNANLQIGYRQRADGTGQEFIPGGPADPKVQAAQTTVKLSAKDAAAREAKYPQATSALKSFDAKTDKFDRDIAELLANEKGLNEITGFFSGRTDLSAMSKEARRALALFNTITAKGGFSELQDMRNASPTGGALGNVSNQEGKQLIDSFAALSRTQNGNDVRKSLETARSDLQNLKQRMREAYELTYEYKSGSASSGPALPPGFTPD